MKRHILNVLFAFVIAAVYFVPQAGSARAASWHAPAGNFGWTTVRICRDGAEIMMVHSQALPSDWDRSTTHTISFAAYQPLFWQTAPTEPTKSGPNQQVPVLGKTYGQVDLTARLYSTPIVVDVEGQILTKYVYAIAHMSWLPPSLTGKKTLLPLRAPVIIKKPDASTAFFYGSVTDCYLFQ